MKVPKKIKSMIMRRRDYASKILDLDAEIHDWADKKGIIGLTPPLHAAIYAEPSETAEYDLQAIESFESPAVSILEYCK